MNREYTNVSQVLEKSKDTKDSLLTDLLVNAVMTGPSSVLLADANGNIEYVNRKFSAITGYELSDAVGKNVSMLNPGVLSEHLNKIIWQQLRDGKNWSGEIEGVRKNGKHYWEQASISPIRSENGKIQRYLKIADDITERKELETQLLATIATIRMHEAQLEETCAQLKETTEELQQSRQKLQQQSQEDALTGLLNRRGLDTELRRLKSYAERQGDPIGFMILDIDNFKKINDNHGHAVGDYILKECADLLRSLLRGSDIISRYGGDEIVVALPSADAKITRLTAKRILTEIRKHDFSIGNIKVPVTVSIGAASEIPVSGENLDNMMKMADHALYYSKRNGRDAMALWSPNDELMFENDDLQANEFSVHSQPFRSVFNTLLAMLDAREKATGDHSKRVTKMAVTLAQAMRLTPAQIELCEEGALLHDIGKVAIPDTILLKPGPLTEEEREIIETHPQIGYNILKSNPEFRDIAEIVLSHQERYDGTGYPRGLKGSEICIGARIFALIDTYDAIRAGRPYADPQSAKAALGEIKSCSGTHFDPEVVDAFIRCHKKIEAVFKSEM